MRLKHILAWIFVILFVGVVAYYMQAEIPFGAQLTKLAKYYIANTAEETGVSNYVTAIVVSYRGFDTLGEVTVLLLATLGVIGLLPWEKHQKKKDPHPVLLWGIKIVFPIILLVGAYIVIHGHLTPGGGFQAGAAIASAFLLYLVTFSAHLDLENFSFTEAIAGAGFALIGVAGIFAGGAFLYNFLPKGVLFDLFSGGIIPIIYILIGLKVSSELTEVVSHMMKGGTEK